MNKIIGIMAQDAAGFYAPKNGGPLPWPKEKSDLDWFSFITKGNILLVGDNTFETLKVLPSLKNREIWPIGKKHELKNIDLVLSKFDKEADGRDLFICGGKSVWSAFEGYYDHFYVTKLREAFLKEGMIYDLDSFGEAIIHKQNYIVIKHDLS